MSKEGVIIDAKISLSIDAYGEIDTLLRSDDYIGAKQLAELLIDDILKCGDTSRMRIDDVDVRLIE